MVRAGFRRVPSSQRQAFERKLALTQAPTLNIRSGAFKNPSLQGAVLFHETVGEPDSLFKRVIRIPVHLWGNSKLTVIHGRVALETEEFNFSCDGVEILESLGDLKTDLTGLRLVHDEALQHRLETLQELIQHGVVEIRRCQKLLPRFLAKGSSICVLESDIDSNLYNSELQC